MQEYILSQLPPQHDVETKAILKKTASAHRFLAELKGVSGTIPNQGILINTLSLQEAKDSSAIENIITTNDDLFKEGLFPEFASSAAAKEVRNYSSALKTGFDIVRQNKLLTGNHIQQIQAQLESNQAGFRKLPGTELKNRETNEIIYIPPQNHEQILNLITNLEKFINDDSMFDVDPLVKMAIIHYQFESIHPFYDGNGRTGRIINVLYLVLKGLLNIPVLYLSRYIIRNKVDYYRLLQKVREENAWDEWVLFMLQGIEDTSQQTIAIINAIKIAFMDFKHRIRNDFKKIYSQDLINNLFSHPYTKIDFLQRDLGVTRLTATKYLESLAEAGFLKKEKLGRSNFYINTALFNILSAVEDLKYGQ